MANEQSGVICHERLGRGEKVEAGFPLFALVLSLLSGSGCQLFIAFRCLSVFFAFSVRSRVYFRFSTGAERFQRGPIRRCNLAASQYVDMENKQK